MNLNITYDQNTLNTAPSGFFGAVSYVVALFDATFTSNVAVNIEIGYGTFPYDNSTVPALAESEQNNLAWGTYSQVRQALINEGAPGSSALPSSSPVNRNLVLDSAQEKALGLIGAGSTLDGWVGIASDATLASIGGSWSYSATAAPGPNQYYLVGVLEHEITEVMGRTSYLDVRGEYGVMDLYRYSSAGVRQTGTGSPAYFSTDGGITNLDSWNTSAGGDIGDWTSAAGADAFLAFSPPGRINGLTTTDLTLMQALGWTTTRAAGDDLLSGTDLPERMQGGAGNDTIYGYGGDDLIYGNQGTDWLDGGEGNDTIYGGQNSGPADPDGSLRQGTEYIFGGNGDDLIYGNKGTDIMHGGSGADTMYGGQDDDIIYGDGGNDIIYGNRGDDLIYGDSADISSGSGWDTIYGGGGIDTAVYLNASDQYDLVRLADGGILINGGEIVYDVEYLKFADQTIPATFI